MRLKITIDGDEQAVDVDLDISRFSMRELVHLEDALGSDRFDQLTGDDPVVSERIARRPRTLQAILYAKIKDRFPGVTVDDFDLPAEVLEHLMTDVQGLATASVVPIPMVTPDGSEIAGTSHQEAVGER